ncbi:hypothetical protein KCH_25700 [Kitasatospora cheerisanensis KCTC 2395]|uniref:Uncharacterized protein n=1 Tax=Kitasatospora cheerisanensis KCTC 2395 TaxID=1348663 RepID=A0A066Z5R8_9ACTN|nr:hypothetical protein KCH_25700 [Kitasatospora cheerisanensis KCTC 2395]
MPVEDGSFGLRRVEGGEELGGGRTRVGGFADYDPGGAFPVGVGVRAEHEEKFRGLPGGVHQLVGGDLVGDVAAVELQAGGWPGGLDADVPLLGGSGSGGHDHDPRSRDGQR